MKGWLRSDEQARKTSIFTLIILLWRAIVGGAFVPEKINLLVQSNVELTESKRERKSDFTEIFIFTIHRSNVDAADGDEQFNLVF